MQAFFVALLLVVTFCGSAASKSLALLIGNNSYMVQNELRTAREDASGYAAFFKDIGYEVTLATDLDQREMNIALARFYDRIEPGDTVAFTFSGHGWSDGIENFLLPTDVQKVKSQSELVGQSIRLRNGLNGIIDEIVKRGPSLTFAIIDACRNTPFQSSFSRSIGSTRGLTEIEAPQGSFIVFSASAGQTSLDSLSYDDASKYSVFTRVFLEELRKPQDLYSAFKATQSTVLKIASDANGYQRPSYYDEVIGRVCLSGSCEAQSARAPQTAAPPAPDAQLEDLHRQLATLTHKGTNYSNASQAETAVTELFFHGVGIDGSNVRILSRFFVQDNRALRQKIGLMPEGAIVTRLLVAPSLTAPRVGDIIISLDGKPTRTAAELSHRFMDGRPDQVHQLKLLRRGKWEVLLLRETAEGEVIFGSAALVKPAPAEPAQIKAPDPARMSSRSDSHAKVLALLKTLAATQGDATAKIIEGALQTLFDHKNGVNPGATGISGVRLQDLSDGILTELDQRQDAALTVTGVPETTASFYPRVGDRIYRASGTYIHNVADFTALVETMRPGEVIDLLVLRRGSVKSLFLAKFRDLTFNFVEHDEFVRASLQAGQAPADRSTLPQLFSFGLPIAIYGDWSVFHNGDLCTMATVAISAEPATDMPPNLPEFYITVELFEDSIRISLLQIQGRLIEKAIRAYVVGEDGSSVSIPAVIEAGFLKPLTTAKGKTFIDTDHMRLLQKGNWLEIVGETLNGKLARIVYSLNGYTKAANVINETCDAKAYWILGR